MFLSEFALGAIAAFAAEFVTAFVGILIVAIVKTIKEPKDN